MKTSNQYFRNTVLLFLVMHAGMRGIAQAPVASIVTASQSAPTVSYLGIKGAGLRQADNALRSNWDSSSTEFTVNYNTSSTADITSISQFLVTGYSSYSIRMPANAIVKLRRKANSYVNDTSNHFNYWAKHSSVPANLSLSGTFNFTAPEIINPEDAFMTNNINSGYDNIFQNTISSLHAGNIERVDFIMPGGLRPLVSQDTAEGGVAVFDRGVGDPFKIAAILSVDANKKPTSYGPLISVTAANFGPNLLSSSFDYCIITHDPKFNNQSRPSSPDNQNIRGVYISLGRLGINLGQRFYGYSLFGPDVTTADPDWNNYPNNTNGSSMLDPINVMNVFGTVNTVLALPMEFNAERNDNKAELSYTIYNTKTNQYVAIERSFNGRDFSEIKHMPIVNSGTYQYTDILMAGRATYYRLKLVSTDGSFGYSEIRKLQMPGRTAVQIYPNPAKDKIWIDIPADWQQQKLTVRLIDVSGRVIQQQHFENADISNLFTLNNTRPGVYFLKLMNSAGEQLCIRKISIK